MSSARLTDISAQGACLVTRSPVAKGEILELELGGRKPIRVLGQVMYACQQLAGSWIVGCRLEGELVQDDLRALVSDVP